MIIDFANINGGGGGGYVLPIASQSTLGGVKVGQNLSIDSAGTLSADAQQVGIATTAQTGVVKIGSGITVDSAGTISADIPQIGVATTAQTGVVKIGQGINVDSAGTISVDEQGGGIEVVSSLPASGTDGQMVMLLEKNDVTLYVEVDGVKKGVGYYSESKKNFTIVVDGRVESPTEVMYSHYFSNKGHIFLLADGNFGYAETSGDDAVSTITPMSGDTDSFSFGSNSITLVKSGSNLSATVRFNGYYEIFTDMTKSEKQTLFAYSVNPKPAIEYHLSNDKKMFNMNWFDIKNVMSDGDVLFYVTNLDNMDIRYSGGTLYSVNRSDWGVKTPSATVSEFVGVYVVWDGDNLQFWFAQDRSVSGGTLFSGKAQMSGWTRVGVVQEDACEGYASSSRLGVVRVDGNGLSMDNGVLKCTVSAPTATTTTAGVVKPSSGLSVSNDGTLTTKVQSSNVGDNVIHIWIGTQVEYDALQTYDQYTVYIVKETTNQGV